MSFSRRWSEVLRGYIAQFPKLIPAFFWFSPESFSVPSKFGELFAKKGRRGFRRRSKSGRKRPGRAETAGTVAGFVLQIEKPRAFTGVNLCSRFFCSATFTRLTRRTVMPITSVGVLTTPGLTGTLFQDGCSHDPDRLGDKAAVYTGPGNNDA